MWPLHLLVALSGFAVTVVLGQNPEQDFADPPPLPEKGMFLSVTCMHQQYLAHTFLCDSPLVQNAYTQ